MSRIWWPYAWTTADRQSKHGISRVLPPGPDGLELISRGEFEEGAELARAGGVPQLVQGLGFDLADTFAGEGERLAHFLERVLAAEFPHQLPGRAEQLVDRLDHMYWDADRARLVGNGSGDGLANPPRTISRELVATAPLELVHGLHEADVPFLDQI